MTDFPSLLGHSRIVIDLETHDPELTKKGPGVRRGGYIVGVAIHLPDTGFSEYYPVAHRNSKNVENVLPWLKEELATFDGEVLGANLLYDMDYLAHAGVAAPRAKWRDVQVAEPLLDETRFSYALEVLGQEYCGQGKVEADIERMFGPKWKEKMRDIPSSLIRDYAIGDVELTQRVFEAQLPKLQEQDLMPLFDLESRVTPMLLWMRRFGVRVDVPRAEQLSNEMFLQSLELKKEFKRLTGFEFVDTADVLAKVFDGLSIPYPRTLKTNKSSFTKAWLENLDHEVGKLIRSIRKLEKTKGTFIDSYVLNGHINGRIHCEFNQLRSDDGGTVSGRFSSSHPNLQNIPSRDEIMGPMMRGLFIPEEGCKWWARDWSQIEFRLLVHYGVMDNARGAAEAQAAYQTDHKADYHQIVAEMMGVGRKDAKNLNFGIIYGMGKAKLARDLNRTVEEAEPLMALYEQRVPFAKALYSRTQSVANRRGYIRTLLGRRRRFLFWECSKWHTPEQQATICKEKGDPLWFQPTMDHEAAVKKWGRVRRAYTHKALNSVVQGSAADLMKKAMVKIWEDGICDVLPVQLTVHDELDGSKDQSKEAQEALEHLHHIMENTHPLHVPVLAEGEEGANWGEAK